VLSLYIYAVPISAHSTRLIINSVTKLPLPKKQRLLSRIPFFANLYRRDSIDDVCVVQLGL